MLRSPASATAVAIVDCALVARGARCRAYEDAKCALGVAAPAALLEYVRTCHAPHAPALHAPAFALVPHALAAAPAAPAPTASTVSGSLAHSSSANTGL